LFADGNLEKGVQARPAKYICTIKTPVRVQGLGGLGGLAAAGLLFWFSTQSGDDARPSIAAMVIFFATHELLHWIALRLSGYPARIHFEFLLPVCVSSPAFIGRTTFIADLFASSAFLTLVLLCARFTTGICLQALAPAIIFGLALWAGDAFWLACALRLPTKTLFLVRGRYAEARLP